MNAQSTYPELDSNVPRRGRRLGISWTSLPLVVVIAAVAHVALGGTEVDASDRVPVLPVTNYDYDADLPGHFLVDDLPGGNQSSVIATDNTPNDNPVTDAGATLGRVLFYDTTLSANGTVACASCHVQEFGFSDPRVLSVGFDGGTTRRHSMSLANAAFFEPGTFFWDERAATLEEQVLEPFQDSVEMGLTLTQLVDLVEGQDYYGPLFEDAFGSTTVTTERISDALAQFVRAIVADDSRYDQGRAVTGNVFADFPNFTASENRGKDLFFEGGGGVASCASCHVTEAMVNRDNGALNNGLDLVSTDDLGLAEVTGRTQDEGKFKTPSLRNIAVTGPYMHDGRFATLEEVVEHYSTGVQAHPNLSGPLDGPGGVPRNRNFTAQEAADLVAFMATLTDTDLLSDPRFSDPFQELTVASCTDGYFVAEVDGDVHGFGDATAAFSAPTSGSATLVDVENLPGTCGYLVLMSDGSIVASLGTGDPGDVSTAGFRPGEVLTSMSLTPSGNGAWVFTTQGRVLLVGDATAFDDGAGNADLLHLDLAGDIVDSVVTADGTGLFMLGSDGGVFTFGTAQFAGSVPGLGLGPLGGAVVGLVPDPDGTGYWAVGADGGVFAFSAPFTGSFPGLGLGALNEPIVGMVAYGDGYLQVATDGGVFNFSSRPFSGSLGDDPPDTDVVAIAPLSG